MTSVKEMVEKVIKVGRIADIIHRYFDFPDSHKPDEARDYRKYVMMDVNTSHNLAQAILTELPKMLPEKKGYCSIVKNHKMLKKETELDRARVEGWNAYKDKADEVFGKGGE